MASFTNATPLQETINWVPTRVKYKFLFNHADCPGVQNAVKTKRNIGFLIN